MAAHSQVGVLALRWIIILPLRGISLEWNCPSRSLLRGLENERLRKELESLIELGILSDNAEHLTQMKQENRLLAPPPMTLVVNHGREYVAFDGLVLASPGLRAVSSMHAGNHKDV